MREVLLQAEVRTEESSNQNFQAETIDRLFSSLGVCLRVIISWILCFLFFFTQRENTLYQGLRAVCPGSIFNDTDDITDDLHNNTISGFEWKVPPQLFYLCDANGSVCHPGIIPPTQGCGQTPDRTKLVHQVWLTNAVLESPLFRKKKNERKKASKQASKLFKFRRSLSPKTFKVVLVAQTAWQAQPDRAS